MSQSENRRERQAEMSESIGGAQPTGCMTWFVREGRLRSGWRVLLYMVGFRFLQLLGAIAIVLVVALVIGVVPGWSGPFPQQMQPDQLNAIVTNPIRYPAIGLSIQAVLLLLTLAIIWMFRQLIDKKSFRSLGFELSGGWWKELLGGFGFTLAGWVVIFLLSLGLGGAVVVGSVVNGEEWMPAIGMVAAGLALNLMVGISEEADARGYVMQNLAEGLGVWPAILLSSLYFRAAAQSQSGSRPGLCDWDHVCWDPLGARILCHRPAFGFRSVCMRPGTWRKGLSLAFVSAVSTWAASFRPRSPARNGSWAAHSAPKPDCSRSAWRS